MLFVSPRAFERKIRKFEQKNWTHIRQWFGYERHDNPAAVPLLNALTTGAWGQLVNLFRPALKLKSKERIGSRIRRVYDEAPSPGNTCF